MSRITKKQELPVYLFHQGTNSHAWELLGAHRSPGGKTTFCTWAPHAAAVSVVGDFNGWDPAAHPMRRLNSEGLWSATIEHTGEYDCYKYAVTAADGRLLYKSDPYAFHTQTPPENASKVYRLAGYRWHDAAWMQRRAGANHNAAPMNIYEVHIGSWRHNEDGSPYSYRQLAAELPAYLVEMGYTHAELLPITEYPYDGSWGYQVTGYYAPSARYGTPHDFMALVDALHMAGIGVIMDWVPAHFPRDTFGLAQFDGDCCYEYADPLKGEHREWGTLVFDYGRNEVQSFLTSGANFWASVYHIDGIRVDAVASMLYLDYGRQQGEWRPNSNGGRENLEAVAFLQKLNRLILTEHPGFMMIAEESTAWPLVTRPPEVGGLGFHYKWNMGWMNDVLHYTRLDPYFRSYNHDKLTFSMMYAFSENFILPISHDEVVHGKGSLLNKMPGSYEEKFAGLRAFLGYMMTHPGKKLLFMGSEFGQFIEWDYQKQLDWLLLDYESHRKTQDYVKAINHFYLENAPLWQIEDSWEGFSWLNADDNTRNVISYCRTDEAGNRLLVFCNFAPVCWENYLSGTPEARGWREIFSSEEERFGGSGFTNGTLLCEEEPQGIWQHRIRLELPPLSCLIFEEL